LTVKINSNRGAQQEISVSTKVSKVIVPFPQEHCLWKEILSQQRIRH